MMRETECFSINSDISKKFCRQHLDQLGLAHAGGAYKDKGCRTAAGTDLHPAAPYSGGHRFDSFVLADDVLFEMLL